MSIEGLKGASCRFNIDIFIIKKVWQKYGRNGEKIYLKGGLPADILLKRIMKRLHLFIAISVAALLITLGFSDEKCIVLGREDNWGAFIKTEGLVKKTGRFGFENMVLKDSEYSTLPETDLLLHFNQLPLREETTNYQISSANISLNSDYALFGSSCAVFLPGRGISLKPTDTSLFRAKAFPTDFTVEFWLYPSALGEGEVIFAWHGFRRNRGQLYPQRLECRIEKRMLVWRLENIFGEPWLKPYQVELKGLDRLAPREWHHHLLRFSCESGLLEYCIDNRPAATRYSSPSGRDEAVLYLPFLGEAENTILELGYSLSGFLDEFRISKEFITQPILKKYEAARGKALSRVFDLGYSGSIISRIEAAWDRPATTEISFYLRTADLYTTREELKAPWIPFVPGTAFKDRIKGRYLQLLIEFYPDGEKLHSPRLAELKICYEPDYPPISPRGLKAVAGNGKVSLSWQAVTEDDVKGYYVFYGDKPLNYHGTDALEGRSPIDVGLKTSFDLTGLKNGKLYYFSLAAYDATNPLRLSDFSEERSARPSEALP